MKILTERFLLQFDHISFAYKPTQPLVLQDVQLKIPPGSLTTILGPNGTGNPAALSGFRLAQTVARIYLAGWPPPARMYALRGWGNS